MTWVLVALAGGAGAVSRYLVDQRVGAWTGARRARRIRRTHLEIPWGTMVVNVSACLLIGLVAALTAGETYRVLATGFLGGSGTGRVRPHPAHGGGQLAGGLRRPGPRRPGGLILGHLAPIRS